MKKKRSTIENIVLIEELLRQNYKLKAIARAIDVELSTISKEIKSRRTFNHSLIVCEKTKKYPFICYNCPKKVNCNKKKYYQSYDTNNYLVCYKHHTDYLVIEDVFLTNIDENIYQFIEFKKAYTNYVYT